MWLADCNGVTYSMDSTDSVLTNKLSVTVVGITRPCTNMASKCPTTVLP